MKSTGLLLLYARSCNDRLYFTYYVRSVTMRCSRCGWPTEEAQVLSTHHTSQGWTRYRRCVCGAVMIELVTVDAGDQPRTEPTTAPRTGVRPVLGAVRGTGDARAA